MTKKMFHLMALCGAVGMALLGGGCVADGGGVVYSDVGYAQPLYAERGPYYGGYGPAYGRETVVIETGSRRGYSDGRRPYRAASYAGRRNGSRNAYSGNRYGESRQRGQAGRGGQAQVQRSRQNKPGVAAGRNQRGANSGRRAGQPPERER